MAPKSRKSLLTKLRYVNYKPVDHPLGFLVAFSGALMQMMTYGIDNSFSIFSDSMQNDPTLGYPSATAVSFGNSVSLGLSPVFGLLAGFLVDRVPSRVMTFASTIILFAGLWLSSTFAHSATAVTFSYCLLASISSAFMLTPGAAATGTWFRKRLGLAQGINFCGGGIGSAWVPAVLGQWVEPYGWRKTFQLMSSFCAIGLVASLISCQRHDPLEDEEVEGEEGEEGGERGEAGRGNGVCVATGGATAEGVKRALANQATEPAAERRPHGSTSISEEWSASDVHSLGDGEVMQCGARKKLSSPIVPVASPAQLSESAEVEGQVAHNGEKKDVPPPAAPSSSSVDSGAAETGAATEGRARALTNADVAECSGENDGEGAAVSSSADEERDELMHALHTRHLTPKEILLVLIRKEFLTNFFMFAIYGWAFYGLIYITVPYVSSMGSAGTVYEDVKPISTSVASTVFTFWGVFQIIGSIAVGALASLTEHNAFAYCLCGAVGGVSCALLGFCRGYVAFAICMCVVGFCTAGMFAVMPALIAEAMHGPNLGFFMGCVFVAACIGGFSAPPMQAQLQTRHHGNYTYGCIVISCCMTAPALICYVFLWPRKQNFVARRWRAMREKRAQSKLSVSV